MQWESGRTRQNLLHSVRESKAKRQTTSGVLSSVPEYLYSPNLSYSFLLMLPHTGQSSQLSVGAHDGNAQFLPNLAGAVVWHTRHKSFKRVLRQPRVDNLRNALLTPTAEMLSFWEQLQEGVQARQVK